MKRNTHTIIIITIIFITILIDLFFFVQASTWTYLDSVT